MKRAILIVAVACGLVACSNAPKSHEVAADAMSSVPYESMSCDRLRIEEASLSRQSNEAAAAVDAHRSKQTGVEVVTWVLFWPAAFALDKGQEHSSRLSRIKGEHEAVRKALLVNRC